MTRRITRTDRDGFDMGGLAHAPTFPGTRQFGDYIERQEAEGQREVVESEQFPTRAPDAELEALGFTFGPIDERDRLFRTATLPAGWKRQGSSHSMWSHIVDDKGRKRVAVFYKAAFYDRDAFAHLVSPTEPLSEALYADKPPRSVTLDELLTVDVAREFVRKEQERIDHYSQYDRDEEDRKNTAQRRERARLLGELVEKAASR